MDRVYQKAYTVEPLIMDTAGEFKFCPLVGVRQVTYGGDSGNRIFVLYWRCSLISVSVIRGSTVLAVLFNVYNEFTL
jgi:hypothetical protein